MAACYRCGAEAGSARFCTNCGTDLASAPPAVQASPLGAGPPPPVATRPPTSIGDGADGRGTGPRRDGLGRKKILLIAGVSAAVGLIAAAAVTIAVTTGTDDPSAQQVPVSAAAPDPGTSAPAVTSVGGASPTPGTWSPWAGLPAAPAPPAEPRPPDRCAASPRNPPRPVPPLPAAWTTPG